MEFPEKLFNKVWILDRQGQVHKAKVISAKNERIEACYDDKDFVYDFKSNDGKVWECLGVTLLLDLHSEESTQLIKDRVTAYSKKVQDDYQKASAEYHKHMSEITEITQYNLKIMNEEE